MNQPDPTAEINALPAGATFTGSGVYDVPYGVKLTKPVTIDGGTWNCATTVPGPPPGQKGYGGMRPIFKVADTQDVNIVNATIIGSNQAGGYHGSLVNQAGIDVLSSDRVTIDNCIIRDTFGDGLEFFFSGPNHAPASNVKVSNVTITNAGRHGVTTAFLRDAVFTNVNVVSQAGQGVDAESDSPLLGMSNVVFDNLTAHGINLINYLTGPVVFNDCTLAGHISLGKGSNFPITVNRGTLTMNASYHGPSAGVYMPAGGDVTFNQTTITRPTPNHGTVIGASWDVRNNGKLTFNQSPFAGPAGLHDITSTVTINQ